MADVEVSFHSAGQRLAGTLKLPDRGSPPFPAIVQGPGWLGLRERQAVPPLSRGPARRRASPSSCSTTAASATPRATPTYLDPHDPGRGHPGRRHLPRDHAPEIDPDGIGVFGSGGTGGGNAVMAAALDERVKAVVAQVPIADGRDWLHRMRREHEWLEFLERVRRGPRAARARPARAAMVAPRDGIMVPTPERRRDQRQGGRRRARARAGRSSPAPRRSSPTAPSTSSTASRRGR